MLSDLYIRNNWKISRIKSAICDSILILSRQSYDFDQFCPNLDKTTILYNLDWNA